MADSSLTACLLPWIVALPALSALLLGCLRRKLGAQGAALWANATFVVGFVLVVVAVAGAVSGGTLTTHDYVVGTWLRLGFGATPDAIAWHLRLDAVSGVWLLIIQGVGALIALFSAGYMRDDPSVGRFFALLCFFLAAMNTLVLGANLPTLFLGWEAVGLASYLLIGFWFRRDAYARAAQKAFVVNRIGDLGLLFALFTAYFLFKTVDLDAIMQSLPSAGTRTLVIGSWRFDGTQAVAVMLVGVMLAVAGKSAQLPLSGWLPDAMAGPTPVSALIHAATMVTAGIYLVVRFAPAFALVPSLAEVFALLGALTALFGATVALKATGLKRVLAYSTISQLGFMVALGALGATGAAVFHVFTHAFFKALLFLSAGGLMHAAHADSDLALTPNLKLKRLAPLAHLGLVIGFAALVGIPGFSGFFSKELLLGAAFAESGRLSTGVAVFALLTAASVCTAFYSVRAYRRLFSVAGPAAAEAGAEVGAADTSAALSADVHETGHHSAEGWQERLALGALALGALLVGWLEGHVIGLPFHAFHTVLGLTPDAAHAWQPLAAGLGASIIGGAVAWWVFRPRQAHVATETASAGGVTAASATASGAGALGWLGARAGGEWGLVTTYRGIDAGVASLARATEGIDSTVLVEGPPAAAKVARFSLGSVSRRFQTGDLRDTLGWMLLGSTVTALWLLWPSASFEAEVVGSEVRLRAREGRGYAYQWHVGAAGEDATAFGDPSFAQTRFRPDQLVGIALHLVYRGEVDVLTFDDAELMDGVALPTHALRGFWCKDAGACLPPALVYRDGGAWILPNDARVEVNGRVPPVVGQRLQVGDALNIGVMTGKVQGLVEAGLTVRGPLPITRSSHQRIAVDGLVAPEATGPSGAVRLPTQRAQAPLPPRDAPALDPAAAEPPSPLGDNEDNL